MAESRLKQIRKSIPGMTLEALAEKIGLSVSQVSRFESGKRRPHVDEIRKIAAVLNVGVADIFPDFAEGKTEEIQVYGYVGARERVDLIPGDDQGAMDEVQPLRAEDGYRAVIVRGNSMLPAYREGDALFFREDHIPIERLIGRDCIVLTADKGRAYVKRIMQGSQKDLFTLLSYAPGIDPLPDVKIERAFPIEWIRRR